MFTLNQGYFSVSCSAGLDMHRKLEGSIAGTAEPNKPKGCSAPWTSCPVYEPGVVGWEEPITA